MNIKNTKIAVTGAEGFIGSHLVEKLISNGAKVKALVQYNSFNSVGWLEEIGNHDSLEIILGDVRDTKFCIDFLKDVDACFHLAALIAIPYSYNAPQSYIDVNVNGTNNICFSALENNLSKLIHTSTSEVYGTAQYTPIDEKHPLQPQSPYSASKISADSIALSYFNSFDLPLSVIRPFNTFGPRQSNRAVIPSIISQMIKNNGEINLGDLSPKRDFNFVSDTVEGFCKILSSKESIGRTINIGSGVEYSVLETVEMIGNILGIKPKVNQESIRFRPKNSEVLRLLSDIKLAKDLLGYEPKVDFMDGLKMTAEWFLDENNLRKYRTDKYVI